MIGQANFDVNEEGFTLQSLIDMNVVQYMEQIVAKSVEATGQAKLRAQFNALVDLWKTIQFVTKNYKEQDSKWILGEIDDMYTQLDEGIASINMILGNRFVKVMRTECENFKKQVTTLNEALDLWTELQRTWMYLENIFSGGSIKQ
jgi:dynein heavy chain